MQKRQSFVPPDNVRKAAQLGLDLHRQWNRGGGCTAIERAQKIAKGEELPVATVRRMAAFFDAAPAIGLHKEEGPSAERINWLLWGGDPGASWVDGMVRAEKAVGKAAGKPIECEVAKVDADLGIVFGWAIVCKVAGEDYFDTQGDNIPETAMLEATAEYMAGDRMAKVMHRGSAAGQVVFGFPMTEDIAKALDIEVNKSGFLVGMKPDDPDILEKFRTGEFTGFSIGGARRAETVVED